MICTAKPPPAAIRPCTGAITSTESPRPSEVRAGDYSFAEKGDCPEPGGRLSPDASRSGVNTSHRSGSEWFPDLRFASSGTTQNLRDGAGMFLFAQKQPPESWARRGLKKDHMFG